MAGGMVLWGHGVCVLAPGGAPSLDAGALILSEGGWLGLNDYFARLGKRVNYVSGV